jgi:hypothetical protein
MWTKAWQNKRPGWTRRVRFFPKGDGMARLEFVEREFNDFGDPPETRHKHSVIVDLVTAEKLYREYSEDETLSGRDVFFRIRIEEED